MGNYVKVEISDGGIRTYLDERGRPHRTDGPAKIRPDGGELWMIHGVIHRLDGPAYKTPGVEAWYHHGEIHRTDGPAYITSDGEVKWYINGRGMRMRAWMDRLHLDETTRTQYILQWGIPNDD
jgi:hypothetical protein